MMRRSSVAPAALALVAAAALYGQNQAPGAVRSRADKFSSISRSAHLPGKSRSWSGMTNSTSSTVACGPAAA